MKEPLLPLNWKGNACRYIHLINISMLSSCRQPEAFSEIHKSDLVALIDPRKITAANVEILAVFG
jgi:hypothetical protein